MSVSWLADKIAPWPTDKLIPYARQQFTGKSATLEGDGRTFDEVAAQRTVKEAA